MTTKSRRQTTTGPDIADRRAAILRAAEDLIVERGLEGFRVRDVAERAGMHHASMLHYYPNREALVQGVVDAIVASLDRVPTPSEMHPEISPTAALRAHFGHVLASMRDHPQRFIVLNELFVRAERDPDVKRVLTATDMSWQGYLLPLLRTGMERGEFRADLDPTSTATLITSFFKGLGLQLGLTPAQRDAAVRQLERLIVSTRKE